MKLSLDHSDGRYYTRELTDDEAATCEALGVTVVHMEDRVYETYQRDCERDAIWQVFFRSISNEQYMRRREKELMPLEDAQREIKQLQEGLARSLRMEKFYEARYAQNLHDRHRETHVSYTCVYPQPGCQVELLPAEWQESANDIIETYRIDRVEDGLKYQGCCCGNTHKLLDATDVQQLRDAGFLTETNSETIE
jgi:hypothetical protein